DEPGPGYIHLPPTATDEDIAQLTAEKLVTMGDKRVFKKTRARNEMIDLWVYALAGLHRLGEKTMNRLGVIAQKLMAKPNADSESSVDDDNPITAPDRPQPRPSPHRSTPGRFSRFGNRWR